MPSLDRTFEELLSKLGDSDNLNPARSDPIFYFVYPPEDMLRVKESLPRWSAILRNRGLEPVRHSMSDLLWKMIDESGRWDAWLESEPHFEASELQSGIRDVLRTDNAMVSRIAQHIAAAPANSIVLFTELEMLHPYFRTRIIESSLHDRVHVPTVMFYPGRRSGQYGLHFLGFYEVDGNYRSTIIGGD